MSTPGTQDPIDAAVAGLTPLAPNQSRAEAVRHRCQAQLARRAVGSRRLEAINGSWTAVAVTVLLGLVSAFYTTAFLSAVLRIEGWLP
jgi:hypothetical protein